MAAIVKRLHNSGCITPANLAEEVKTASQRAAAKRALKNLAYPDPEITRLLAGTYKRRLVPFDDFHRQLAEAVAAGTETPEFVSHLTDGLLYSASAKDTSKSTLLSRWRAQLKKDGLGQSLIDATFRPNMTMRRNAQSDLQQQKKQAVQITVPDLWRTPGALTLRLSAWRANRKLDGADVADALVALSARPNELATLKVDPNAKTVTGMLKKRGDADVPVPYVGSVPAETARKVLEVFQRRTPKEQRALLRSARDFVASMPNWAGARNNTLRDLRAFGAHLAVERSRLEGGGNTDAARMETRAAALRHLYRRPAVAHYSHVG